MAHHPPSYGHPHPPYYQQQEAVGDVAKTTVVGYELLADKLTELSHNEKGEQMEGKILPMYRKFEQLNHRVLLHLQDEISELEEELRYLDECIARASPPEESHHRHTASRRNEARYGGELHYRRTELLGRVYLKLGQYNQALSSFSNMLKDLDAPNTDQVQVYRSWMERHAPVERSEAQFLDRKHDLVAVLRRGSATTVGGVNPHQSAAMGLPLIALIPLMLFAIVPGFLGRLFIIAVIGAAEVSVVTSTELMDLMAVREWVICASGYFGLMAILAGLVH
jgi:tetratricopeptide (TPR) repeat protein